MTSTTQSALRTALRRAAVRATYAPSVHNTQPWRLRLGRDTLEIHADRDRQLRVLDPLGRQLALSCGCALFNVRVTLAASGYTPSVERLPDPTRPDLLARVTVLPAGAPADAGLARLDGVIEERRTNRRAFSEEAVPEEMVEALIDAAAQEEGVVVPIERLEHRLATARLSQRADRIQNSDPTYRAELRAWTSDDPRRPDGVDASVVPHVDAGAEDDLPVRDFDTHGAGRLHGHTRSSLTQCLLLLGTAGNDRTSWIQAGEALERVLLEITRRGYAASPLTQVVEVATTNQQLRAELGLHMYPHVLLRVGRAPATPPTRRRRLVDVLTEMA